MKIYGFYDEGNGALNLNQATLEVDSKTLRKLSEFFSICADEMDADEDWSHEHFCDFLEEELEADVVVYRKK